MSRSRVGSWPSVENIVWCTLVESRSPISRARPPGRRRKQRRVGRGRRRRRCPGGRLLRLIVEQRAGGHRRVLRDVHLKLRLDPLHTPNLRRHLADVRPFLLLLGSRRASHDRERLRRFGRCDRRGLGFRQRIEGLVAAREGAEAAADAWTGCPAASRAAGGSPARDEGRSSAASDRRSAGSKDRTRASAPRVGASRTTAAEPGACSRAAAGSGGSERALGLGLLGLLEEGGEDAAVSPGTAPAGPAGEPAEAARVVRSRPGGAKAPAPPGRAPDSPSPPGRTA